MFYTVTDASAVAVGRSNDALHRSRCEKADQAGRVWLVTMYYIVTDASAVAVARSNDVLHR
ncbi:hypothetical protein [Paenibacillus aceris]|uniref:DUF4258 domain-containing protein n=1 Tax=Paenibacillus aceris TaxID=869555 RepID=A0ABS4I1K7_9BACL|nr:hypothetical protein [Paenibacillus aceris]MBP1964029.1 hypothetical protein [Paenibacillus aceris]NHW34556.1 hypothetical protein [Paenibacillus aceris]